MPEMDPAKRGSGPWRRKDYQPKPTPGLKWWTCYLCGLTGYARNAARASHLHYMTEHYQEPPT